LPNGTAWRLIPEKECPDPAAEANSPI